MTETPIEDERGLERCEFLGVDFDLIEIDGLLRLLRRVDADTPYSYVVTPNVDHVVRKSRLGSPVAPELSRSFAQARWCVCDSRVLSLLARLRGVSIPVIAGSDLTERLFSEVLGPGDAIAIVGGADHAADRLRDRHPALVIKQHIPPVGLLGDEQAMREAVEFVAASRSRFAFLAVGSPQQEIIARRLATHPNASGVAFCVGASIDFLTGDQRRAPRLLRSLSLEWAYRLATNPRRLWRRYLVDGPRIFGLAARWSPSPGGRDGRG
jgi:exopolysaccharide biosynthesis WecB/TagA/CpsF family protein